MAEPVRRWQFLDRWITPLLASIAVLALIAAYYLGRLSDILVPTLILVGLHTGLIWSLPNSHRHTVRVRAIILLASYLVLTVMSLVVHLGDASLQEQRDVAWLFHALLAMVLIAGTVQIIVDLLYTREVMLRSLMAGLFGFLALGVAWVHIYTAVYLQSGRLFQNDLNSSTTYLGNYFHLLYYSLVTLTTLGYGDLTPVGVPARLAASLEAVIGQFYMAVFVGSLVGMYLGRGRNG